MLAAMHDYRWLIFGRCWKTSELKALAATLPRAIPDPENLTRAAELPAGEDEWSLLGPNLHLRFAKGMGDASLNLDALLKRLGAAGTPRNLRSVNAIITLAHK